MTDDIIEFMLKHDIPITRERYLGIAYPNGLPEDYGFELEAELPEELQDPGAVMGAMIESSGWHFIKNVYNTERLCHFRKIRKNGYSAFYMSKGWRPVGYGAAKRVGGKERLMFTKAEGDDYVLCGFCIRIKKV